MNWLRDSHRSSRMQLYYLWMGVWFWDPKSGESVEKSWLHSSMLRPVPPTPVLSFDPQPRHRVPSPWEELQPRTSPWLQGERKEERQEGEKEKKRGNMSLLCKWHEGLHCAGLCAIASVFRGAPPPPPTPLIGAPGLPPPSGTNHLNQIGLFVGGGGLRFFFSKISH